MTEPEHVLVPVDDSEPARDALEFAVTNFADATLTLLHVINPIRTLDAGNPNLWDESHVDSERERAEGLLEAVAADVPDDVDVTTVAEFGDPAETVVEYASRNGVDHVVIGSHGRSGVKRLVLGSVAEAVSRQSPIPVSIVR
ncbi:universal stress protein [Natronobeatus ordinarius]|uniref:universal stress protein n=1 Tax=Natronobeatus ordinarius TaxID=2963433 RepID=UPI0020CDDE6B|nr:universal stress protein [Natronobeatus ordinarius]